VSRQQVSRIQITTTVTLIDNNNKSITSVSTSEEATPGVFGGSDDKNLHATARAIHDVSRQLGERVAVQAVAGLKEIA